MGFKKTYLKENDSPYFIAEIGINHNGDLELAKELIKISYDVGFDCVKFQKRVPELSESTILLRNLLI